MIIKKDNFNDIFIDSIYWFIELGKINNPRGMECIEILYPQIILTNPLNCLITIKERKLNYAYSIIEKFMYLSGVSYPDITLAYNSNMERFINKEIGDFDGAYGLRINSSKVNQLVYCYETLCRDKDTRQAVITIHNENDCRISNDITCTLSLQFIIRENKLHLVCNMRSNDIYWGSCLDFPAFCFLQEVMLSWLKPFYKDLKLGNYIHQPTSFHYYTEFEDKLISIAKSKEINSKSNPLFNLTFNETNIAINKFWEEEKNIRINRQFFSTNFRVIDEYLKQLLNYWNYKDNKKYEKK